MSFVYPQFFWVMIVPFAVFVLLVLTNRDSVSRVFDDKALKRLRAGSDTIPNSVRNMIFFAAIFSMITALSRPVIENGEKMVNLQGITAVVALDISGSMRSKDIYPNRLEFAKKKIAELFEYMPGDEVALSAFAYSSFVLAPFTTDKATLKQISDGVNENYINMESTNFLALEELAENLLKDKPTKVLIVFTDGGDEENVNRLEKEFKKSGITLYAVLVGSEKGAPVLDRRGKAMKRRDGSIIITRRNDKLGLVAKESGGDYVIARNGHEDMRKLSESIHSKFSRHKHGVLKIKDRKEFFYYPLIVSIILLIVAFSSMPAKRRSNEF